MKFQRFQNYNKSPKSSRTLDGITFDSQLEMRRYCELKQQMVLGIIDDLQTQITFELQPSFVDSSGEKQRAINYVADFVYKQNGKQVVEDVKSKMTYRLPQYILKKKLFMFKFPEYIFFENVL